MTGDRNSSTVYGELVDRLILEIQKDTRIRALWIEGESMEELRRPYKKLEVHLATDEPDFADLQASLEKLVAGEGKLSRVEWSEVPRFASQLEAVLEEAPITVVLEKTSLLAKRPRLALLALADKTGHLNHVLDFSPKH